MEKFEVITMLRTMTVTLALTTGLIWGMVGCAYGGEKNAPLDMYLGQLQSQPSDPAAYPAEWSPMTLPPVEMFGLGLREGLIGEVDWLRRTKILRGD
jgi:hypothetical protein